MSARQPLPKAAAWRWTAWPFWQKATALATAVVALSAGGALASRDIRVFPAWLEASSTLAALIAAAAAARYAARAFELEAFREDRWQASQLQAQADVVAAWFVPDTGQRHPRPSPAVAFVNASAVPVYNVGIILVGIPELTGADVNDDVDYLRAQVPSTLGPTGAQPVLFHLTGWQRDAANNGLDLTAQPAVQLEFTDARGQRWMRRTDGTLLLDDEWP